MVGNEFVVVCQMSKCFSDHNLFFMLVIKLNKPIYCIPRVKTLRT